MGHQERNAVNFCINGKRYSVEGNSDDKIGADSHLVDFIRDRAGLKGTKFMCREGGCGACMVTVTSRNPNTGKSDVRSINSCLTPVLACDGWDITTVEGLGSCKNPSEMHPIQERMVKFHGSQCGFCTPGWVMNMYGVMESKKSFEAKDIEDCMDGNICRCTGYRPILDVAKSLAVDPPTVKCIKFENKICDQQRKSLLFNLKSGVEWVMVVDLNSLFSALQRFKSKGWTYRIVGGNTGKGVYKEDGPYDAFVEVTSVPILTKITVDSGSVTLGGTVTISDAIEALKKASENDHFKYCQHVACHWKRIANTGVRNAGTLAGNLMLKHDHHEFPSDIFIVLEAIGATLLIASAPNLQGSYTPQEFLKLDMTGKVIQSIQFPKLKDFHFRSFKISRRFQNAHAYVNAGFLLQTDTNKKFVVTGKPRITFGGINPKFVHAEKTENFLVGKNLQEEKTIQGAMEILAQELNPDAMPLDADPTYRTSLAQSLLYKTILGILGNTVAEKMISGGVEIERKVTSSQQAYDTDESQWPIHKSMPKIEAPLQSTGEAEYTNDISSEFGELFGAFVLTKVANATLEKVDASEALKIPGVVAFVDANDIPGVNNYMTSHFFPNEVPDEIFVQKNILYAGQPVGVILAETSELAMKAVKLVKIEYSNMKQPILDIKSALEVAKKENKLESCTILVANGEESKTDKTLYSLSGEWQAGSQYHFHMEPQTCICVPREHGIDVFAATQWTNQLHGALSDCLAIPTNAINVQVRRLGGGFGGKLARASHVATACAVSAMKVNRPVRMVVDLESAMSALGKRHPYLFKYNVSFDDTGKIHSLDIPFYSDAGCTPNEGTAYMAYLCIQSCYNTNGWKVSPGQVLTHSPPNTYCRAPGTTQAMASMEYIMEHIAFNLKKDPTDVRLANLFNAGDAMIAAPGVIADEENKIPELFQELKKTSNFDERKKAVQAFNEKNRWKKRGLVLSAMRYQCERFFSGYNIFVSIHAKDGTVAISHSGIEMGQGLNTKVVQVVAKHLNISMDKIKVRPTTSFMSPNCTMTGGALTSETVCFAAIKACEILVDRMAPIKEKLDNPSWETLVAESHKACLDLTTYYNATYNDNLKGYGVWGAAACEVEIDCLTGEYKISRVDLINDAGLSISPDVDVGQVEGAFVMGLGLWLTEKIQFDKVTGELLTNRTWDYKVPLPKDIPEDFRVTLKKNSTNPHGILRSKATGEAPIGLSIGGLLALKQAITAARHDAGNTEWFQLDAPVTPEDVHRLSLTTPNHFSTN